MKRNIHKIFAALMAVSILFSGALPTHAAELSTDSSGIIYDVNLPFNGEDHYYEEVRIEEEGPNARTTYVTVYGFEYDKSSLKYGSWINGVSGGSTITEMPLVFNYTHDTTYNISFTASVTGSYTSINKNTIGSTLGVTLGASTRYSLGVGTSCTVPKGQHYTIKYRPAYYTYTVTEIKYSEAYITGYGWHRLELGRQTSYVDVFSHWDFTVSK